MNSAEYRDKVGSLEMPSVSSTPAQLADDLKADLAQWRKVVSEAGIKIE